VMILQGARKQCYVSKVVLQVGRCNNLVSERFC
jgi:hypothetical protein